MSTFNTIKPRGTNRYFDQFTQNNEQYLIEDLWVESISIFGHNTFYLPRTLVSFDRVYGEDDISQYNEAIPIEMYIKTVDGFQGDSHFLSKFGLEVRDQVIFTIARRVFNEEVTLKNGQERPKEGDIIYFPLNKRPFQIRYVNHLEFFYQLGKVHTWEVTCETFEYSSEYFDTGIPEIDSIRPNHSTNILDYAVRDEEGNIIYDDEGHPVISEEYNIEDIDPAADNDSIEDEQNRWTSNTSDDLIDWSERNPWSEKY